VEAGEKKDKTKEQLNELVQIIEESSNMQQQQAEAVALIQERLTDMQDLEAQVCAYVCACVCVCVCASACLGVCVIGCAHVCVYIVFVCLCAYKRACICMYPSMLV
jgi:hypothetical protein